MPLKAKTSAKKGEFVELERYCPNSAGGGDSSEARIAGRPNLDRNWQR